MNGLREWSAELPNALFLVVAGALPLGSVCAQDIEPRRWAHLPLGTDIVGLGYIYTKGDLQFDPALRLEDVKVDMHTFVASYNHYFGLFDKTARLDVQLPWQDGDWSGLLDGTPASTGREGFGDPRLRLSVDFIGAPALEGREFLDFIKQEESNTIVGAAVAVRLPLGDYKDNRLLNLGQNRFSVETQLGAVHKSGPWSFELTGSLFVYTDNDEFYAGTTLSQDPLYFLQSHVVRSFDSGLWAAAGVAYGWAGESSIDGRDLDDDKQNLQYGLSLGMPISASQSLRIGYIRGETFTDVGMDSHSLLLTWSMRL